MDKPTLPYEFPRLQFDRTRHISLNQAFHIVGSYKFPDTWLGDELFALQEEAVVDLRHEKDLRIARAKLSQDRVSELSVARYEDREKYDELNQLYQDALSQRDLDKINCKEFLRGYDGRRTDAEAFHRRQTVEDILCRVIRTEELKVVLAAGTGVEMKRWAQSPEHRVCFKHSYIVSKQNLGGRDKNLAYFKKDAFDSWVTQFERHLSEFEIGKVEDAFIDWFKTETAKLVAEGKRATRNDLCEKCKAGFLRFAEIEKPLKAVDAAWELFAPKDWKRGGKPSNQG